MKAVAKYFVDFLKREEGVTAVECALMLFLVVIICIVAINQANPNSVIGEPVVVQVTATE